MEILGRIAGIAAAATIIAGAASAATYNIELANANSDGNKDGIRATLTCEACEIWFR